VFTVLRFSSRKPNKNKIDPSIHVGLWSVDPIDGGILDQIYPSTKIIPSEALDRISDKIKKLIHITVRDMTFKSEWSLSPITINSHHIYLYGFFASKWRVISIHLPIDFSLWLIHTKSNLLIFESAIANKVSFFPVSEWELQVLLPIHESFVEKKDDFVQNQEKSEVII
jgi:hypothetical protein